MVEMMTERARAVHKQFMFERRLLFTCTGLVLLSVVLWSVSMSTDHWVSVSGGKGIYINVTRRYFMHSHYGIFKQCRTAIANISVEAKPKGQNVPEVPTTPILPLEVNMSDPEVLNGTKEFLPMDIVDTTSINTTVGTGTRIITKIIIYRKCKFHDVFPTELKILQDPTLDDTILSYTRTEIMFSIISLIVMIMGFLFSIYTFRNPRYMFKRLAGGIHLITSLSLIVVIEVFMNSIDYEIQNLPVAHPPGAIYTYEYSYYFAWIVFLLNMVSGISFMWYSKKRKGNKAPNEEIAMADEPTIIGR
uniref:Uncharacterized protein n=1 Tax=Clastoptera arizonana TaxID=38151 RepID=A0A1B6C522_9HEMI